MGFRSGFQGVLKISVLNLCKGWDRYIRRITMMICGGYLPDFILRPVLEFKEFQNIIGK